MNPFFSFKYADQILENGTEIRPIDISNITFEVQEENEISRSGTWFNYSNLKAKVDNPLSSKSKRKDYTYFKRSALGDLVYHQDWTLIFKWFNSDKTKTIDTTSFIKQLSTIDPFSIYPQLFKPDENGEYGFGSTLICMLLENAYDFNEKTLKWSSEQFFLNYFPKLSQEYKQKIVDFRLDDGCGLLEWAIFRKKYLIANMLASHGATLNVNDVSFEALFSIIEVNPAAHNTQHHNSIQEEYKLIAASSKNSPYLDELFEQIFEMQTNQASPLFNMDLEPDFETKSKLYLVNPSFSLQDKATDFIIFNQKAKWFSALLASHPNPQINSNILVKALSSIGLNSSNWEESSHEGLVKTLQRISQSVSYTQNMNERSIQKLNQIAEGDKDFYQHAAKNLLDFNLSQQLKSDIKPVTLQTKPLNIAPSRF